MVEAVVSSQALVDPQWVAEHLGNTSVRVVAVGSADDFAEGHVPGAVHWDWERDVIGGFRLQPIAPETMEALLSRSGITPATTVVLYGDWPTLSFWLLTLFGHADVRILDGGLDGWTTAGNATETGTERGVPPTSYPAPPPNLELRADHAWILERLGQPGVALLDVRTAEEYSGEHMWPGDPPGYCQRAGHIPGAKHLPWNETIDDEGRFRPVDELRRLVADVGISPDDVVVPYCTIGGRSSHVWFVLTQLLGFPRVRLYDGSWLEWAHLVDAPIERSRADTAA